MPGKVLSISSNGHEAMPALAPMLHCFVKKERRGAKNPILETNHHWVKTNHPGRRHSEEQQKYNRAMSDDTGSERGTQNFCSQTSYHQSLSQLRDKIHLSSTSHHKPGCGCSRMPSDGHGRERGGAQGITLPAARASPRSHHRTKASAHGQQKSGVGRGCGECHTTKGR